MTGLRYVVWFAGAGGDSQGAVQVPGVELILAANHDQLAIESHAANFPRADHFRGDIQDLDVAGHPYGELFWASPECTNWSVAKGVRADYADHPGLWDEQGPAEDVQRSRALMEDVVRYLRGMHLRQRPVLAGVVENVVDVRRWTDWDRWLGEIQALGYRTRIIALNSAHAKPRRSPRAPQSRDRLYVAYWHESLKRDPDWDKWLRPECWCESCGEIVAGVQTWKRPGQDMGRYGAQYYYRCPKTTCRGARVEPFYSPAAAAIDWTIPGQRIGDRNKPLSPKTMARIEAALRRWGPSIVEAAGNQYDSHDPRHPQHGQPGAYSRSWPLDTLTASGTHHGLLVPAGGTWHDEAHPTTDPMRTLTTRESHGLLVPYYSSSMGGTPTDRPMGTLTSTDRFALVMRNNTARGDQGQMATPVHEVLRTLTTAGHQSLLEPPSSDVLDCLFRMLEPHEIGAGMAFLPDYIVLGNKRERVRQYGAAVTPPVAEVLIAALVECIQGHDIDWSEAA